jgi:transcriptional regulator with XRE-family HTH domain
MDDSLDRPDIRNILLGDAEHFGRTVERLRLERGYDRPQFADRAGVSTKTLLAVERGTHQRRQQSTLLKLAQALDLTYDELMSEAGEAPLAPADGDRAASVPPRPRLRLLLAVAAVVVGVLVAATAWTGARRDTTLPTFAVEQGKLVARDHHNGEMVWRLEAEATVTLAHTLPDDDERLLVGLGTDAIDGGWCMLVDRRSGRVRWRYRPDPEVAAAVFDDPDLAIDGGFGVMNACFPDLDGDGDLEVVVNFMHNQWYPSVACVLGPRGGLQSSYWNRGRIYDSLVADLDGDGKDEMVWTATNNVPAYRGASILLLDDECRRGASFDPVSGGRHDWPDSARVRVVIPTHDHAFLDDRGIPRLKAVHPRTRVGPDGAVRVQVTVMGVDDDAAFVTLDADLAPLSVVPTDALLLNLGPWLQERHGSAAPTVQQWLDQWLAGAVRFEAGHWPPVEPPS